MTQAALQQTTLCMGDAATLRVTYYTESGAHHFEIPREPPSGLSAARLSERLEAFTKALHVRHAVNAQRFASSFYRTADERIAHARWLNACASTMEREAKMHRILALRIAGQVSMYETYSGYNPDHKPT